MIDSTEASKAKKITVQENEPAIVKRPLEPTKQLVEADIALDPAKKETVAGPKVISPLTKNTEASDHTSGSTEESFKVINSEPTDALPDSADKLTARTDAQMQSPKLFDTKHYHLPISQSTHSHGFMVGSILFGVIFAAVMAVLIIYIFY